MESETCVEEHTNRLLEWIVPSNTFVPAKSIPSSRPCKIYDINRNSRPIQVFHKMFPHSLYLQIVNCTNERIQILNNVKKQKHQPTDKGELQKILAVMMVMSYNYLPSLKNYWSNKESMGNRLVKRIISRDRYMVVTSKLYFSLPEKPPDATKTYYVDELLSCLKHTFRKYRQDSPFQSID